jgi:hypothetical protein
MHRRGLYPALQVVLFSPGWLIHAWQVRAPCSCFLYIEPFRLYLGNLSCQNDEKAWPSQIELLYARLAVCWRFHRLKVIISEYMRIGRFMLQ